jgi:hypothetical protein
MSKMMLTRLLEMKAFILRAASPSPGFGIAISKDVAMSQLNKPCKNVILAVKYSNS